MVVTWRVYGCDDDGRHMTDVNVDIVAYAFTVYIKTKSICY